MTQDEFKDIMDRYLQGNATKEEEKMLLRWFNRVGKEDRSVLDATYKAALEEKLWSNLKGKIRKNPPAIQPGAKPRTYAWMKMAAAVLALLVVSSLIYLAWYHRGSIPADGWEAIEGEEMAASFIEVSNPGPQIKVITLQDKSLITLSPRSEIRYPKSFKDTRNVYLRGEAFFSVTRDTLHPFRVYANEIVTQVLGTSFSVKAYGDEKEITVAVRSGKVSVYKKEKKQGKSLPEVILSPNQKAVYDIELDQVLKQLVDEPVLILPASPVVAMDYDNVPVTKIFDELEVNYGVEIVFDHALLKDCNLTTSLTDEGLYERIRIICRAIGADYQVVGTRIMIESAGCN